MIPADNTEELVEQMHLKTRPLTDERILKDAFASLEKSSQSAYRKTTHSSNLKRFVIATAAAAAVVIAWAGTHFLISDYSKLSAPKQIFNALDKDENFCISNYRAGSEVPFEQVWVSKQLEMKMFSKIEANSNFMTLWDISRNVKISEQGPRNIEKTEPITEKMETELEKSLVRIFSLSRFSSIGEIPKTAAWQKVHDPIIVNQVPDTQVFELSWQQKNSAGQMQYFKWRIFLSANNYVPRRTEVYIKSSPNDQYELDSYSIISHPGEEEIKDRIRENFGPIISSPEYQPTGGQ